MSTLNIRKNGPDQFVAWYDQDNPEESSTPEMSQFEARNVMRLALITDVQVRLQNLKGDEMINFISGDNPPQNTEELVDSYRALSAGKAFAIHAWSEDLKYPPAIQTK